MGVKVLFFLTIIKLFDTGFFALTYKLYLFLTKEMNDYIFIIDKGKTTVMWRRKTTGSLTKIASCRRMKNSGLGFLFKGV